MPKPKKFRPTCIRQWRHYRGLTLERGYTQDTVEALASAMRTDPAALLTRDPTDPNALWGLWDKAKPGQRKQILEAAIKVVKGRSSAVKGRSNARKRGHR
jgi:hypothetical protein